MQRTAPGPRSRDLASCLPSAPDRDMVIEGGDAPRRSYATIDLSYGDSRQLELHDEARVLRDTRPIHDRHGASARPASGAAFEFDEPLDGASHPVRKILARDFL